MINNMISIIEFITCDQYALEQNDWDIAVRELAVIIMMWYGKCKEDYVMVEINLTQAEAEALIAMEKYRANEVRNDFPLKGESLRLPLQSPDRREQFLLDLSRGNINSLKFKMQNRARQAIVLVRIDLGGSPHRNPDDVDIPAPHLNIYREGCGDKWAIPVPGIHFRNVKDLWTTYEDFLRFCSITMPPHINRGLFV